MTFYRLLDLLFNIFQLLILIRVIVSFVRPKVKDQRVIKALRFVYEVTEPVLAPVRNILARYTSPEWRLDFSPFIVLLLLPFVQRLLYGLLSIFI